MREEIRPINRLFVRFWMNKTDIQLPDYQINYTCNEYKKSNIKEINIIYNFYYKRYGKLS